MLWVIIEIIDIDIGEALLDLKNSSKEIQATEKDNLAIIKVILSCNSITLSTCALLCLKNYPRSLYAELEYEKFTQKPNDPFAKRRDLDKLR